MYSMLAYHACAGITLYIYIYIYIDIDIDIDICMYVCMYYILHSSLHCNPTVDKNKVHCHGSIL